MTKRQRDLRTNRYLEIEAEMAEIQAGRVVDGDLAGSNRAGVDSQIGSD